MILITQDGFKRIPYGIYDHKLKSTVDPPSLRTRSVELLKTIYPQWPNPPQLVGALQRGYAHIPSSKAFRIKAREWISIIDSELGGNDPDNTELEITLNMMKSPALSDKYMRDWVSYVQENILSLFGLDGQMLVWHTSLIKNYDNSLGISGDWHYDNHYPAAYAKVLIYLNDVSEHSSGTDFFDWKISDQISSRTHYCGFTHQSLSRTSKESEFATSCELGGLYELRPQAGESVLFFPSKVLHRGIPAKNFPRYSLSFSLMPSPGPLTEDVSRALVLSALSQQIPGNDIPLFFLRNFPNAGDGSLTEETPHHANTKFSWLTAFASFIRNSNSSHETEQFLALVLYLSQLMEYKSQNDFILDVKNIAAQCKQVDHAASKFFEAELHL